MADDKERAEIKRQLTELTELRTPDNKVLEANKNNPRVAEISMSENVFPKNTKQRLNQVRNTQIEPFENDSCLQQVSYSDSQVSMDETDVCLGPTDLCKPSEDDTSNCEVSVETITPILEVQNDGDIHSYNNQAENTMESQQRTDNVVRYQVDFTATPVQVTGSWGDFESIPQNFLKGCKWSPDGTCILTCSDDNILRIFNLPIELYSDFISCDVLPEMSSVLKMREGETVYDCNWYPKMSSYDPDTCCFISTSRDHPLHLWDAFTGKIRCTYRAYNNMDEIVSPHCVAFSLDGSKIYSGFNKMVRVFDTSRPGRECQKRPTVTRKQGQFGIISCIAVSPESNGLYACGSFSKSVGIYAEPKGNLLTLAEEHQGGVTHLVFSPDGHKLYSGGRKDNEIICWDMRYPGAILNKLLRSVNTNQRMYFDIDSSGKYLVSGNHDGTVSIWDTCTSSDVILPCHMTYVAHDDCVNGISLHPRLPLLATTSGQRKFIQQECENNDNEEIKNDNSLRLWKLGCGAEETKM